MRFVLTSSLVSFLTVTALAQHPMPPGMSHEEHLKQLARDEALKRRGAAAMGFDQDTTVHHFLLAPDGGAIAVSIRRAADTAGLASVRAHLRDIAAAFAAGEFEKPLATHGEMPPGVRVITERKSAITYQYRDTAEGGSVEIRTQDATALAAVHEFLRYQIVEHKTGDPLTVGQ